MQRACQKSILDSRVLKDCRRNDMVYSISIAITAYVGTSNENYDKKSIVNIRKKTVYAVKNKAKSLQHHICAMQSAFQEAFHRNIVFCSENASVGSNNLHSSVRLAILSFVKLTLSSARIRMFESDMTVHSSYIEHIVAVRAFFHDLF